MTTQATTPETPPATTPATPPAAAPKPFIAFGALWFSYFASLGLFNPYAPLWFQSLGYGTVAIGAIASLQSWTRVVAPYAWGWLADHRGHRVSLLRTACAMALLASVGFLFTTDYTALALITLCVFLANGAVIPLSEAALGTLLHATGGMNSGRYGRVRAWGSVGFIVAVGAYGVVLDSVGIDLFPWFVVAMFGLLALASLRLPPSADTVAHPGPEGSASVLAVLRNPAVRWFFASVFFTVLAHTSLYAFLSLYLDSLGFGKPVVGAVWIVSVAVEIGFFWTQGRWFSRYSPHGWLIAAAAVSVLRFAAMAAFGTHLVVLVLAQALHAVTFAAHHAACVSLLARHFPGRLRARGQALYTTLGYGISGVIGGFGGGLLSEQLGFAAVFWAAALAAACGVACATVAFRRERRG